MLEVPVGIAQVLDSGNGAAFRPLDDGDDLVRFRDTLPIFKPILS